MIENRPKTFMSDHEYISWAESQDWYQAIKLRNGYVTKGNEFEGRRGKLLSSIDYSNKRVLDVGCNSGKYALAAKAAGAAEVIGVDIDDSVSDIQLYRVIVSEIRNGNGFMLYNIRKVVSGTEEEKSNWITAVVAAARAFEPTAVL